MKCRIAQPDRCGKSGCEFNKLLNENCMYVPGRTQTFEEYMGRIEHNSKKQALVKIEKTKRTGTTIKKRRIPVAKPSQKRKNVWVRDKGICYLCNLPVSLKEFTIDHVIPKSKGGKSGMNNLKATHLECNRRKGDSIL